MSSNTFLKQLTTGDTVKDFSHASKTFVDSTMRLAPKSSFLYHVAFDIVNSSLVPASNLLEAGMMVKNVTLPRFTSDVKTYNAYNRVNLVQSKLKYDPVTITFHDDMANVVRDFWYAYYSYYYTDAKHVESIYSASHKYVGARTTTEWGYNSSLVNPFMSAIRIYQLHQKQYSEYTLINPIITNWQHGQQTAGESAPVESTMTVSFETVKYKTGAVNTNNVKGFGEVHYDKAPSPLTPAGGGTSSILGPGGLVDTAASIGKDLAEGDLLSAAFKTVRTASNFKGQSLTAKAKTEARELVNSALRGNDPTKKFFFPTMK